MRRFRFFFFLLVYILYFLGEPGKVFFLFKKLLLVTTENGSKWFVSFIYLTFQQGTELKLKSKFMKCPMCFFFFKF